MTSFGSVISSCGSSDINIPSISISISIDKDIDTDTIRFKDTVGIETFRTRKEKEFPKSFQEFLSFQGIDFLEYNVTLEWRYLRLNQKVFSSFDESLKAVEERLSSTAVYKVPWMPTFYAAPASFKLAKWSMFKDALIYGLDVASGVAVQLLDPQPNDQILDLCCAPGSKLAYISDLIGVKGTGTITGVDSSKQRLEITRSVLKKYKCHKTRIFMDDGRRFWIPPVSRIGPNYIHSNSNSNSTNSNCNSTNSNCNSTNSNCNSINTNCNCNSTISKNSNSNSNSTISNGSKEKKAEVKAPFYASRLIRDDPQSSLKKYDKCLVDAECTHDGSIAHVEKQASRDWSGLASLMDPERLAGLHSLQTGLLENGVQVVRVGGVIVYSTCSFCISQNEMIVFEVIRKSEGKVVLLEIPPKLDGCNLDMPVVPIAEKRRLWLSLSNRVELDPQEENVLRKTVRFSPRWSGTSGLFVAKLQRIK